MNELDRMLESLHRYHDGDLQGLERWLFKRRLRRSPALQAELEAIRGVSRAVVAHVEEETTAAGPDLWARLAPQLSAIDAQVAGETAAGRVAPRTEVDGREGAVWPGWFGGWQAGATVAAAALLAWVMVVSPGGSGTEVPASTPVAAHSQVVRYLDSGGVPVMMIDREDVTIVWMMDSV